jgi:hypothetical protein
MKSIKFRAWHYEDRKMYFLETIDMYSRLITVTKKNEYDQECSAYCRFSEVEIMQYTGVTDKNGNSIYEGDILKLDRDELLKNLEPEDVSDDTLIQVVAFEDGAFTARSRSGIKWGSVGGMFEYGEIIGNIYENPELLQ